MALTKFSQAGLLGLMICMVTGILTASVGLEPVIHAQPPVYLQLDGMSGHIQVTERVEAFSVREGLTVSAWIRPDTLHFPRSEGSGYVHWLGKGSRGLPGALRAPRGFVETVFIEM